MRSYQIVEFGKPLAEAVHDAPEPEGSEVLVRVTGCGVCHSDVHLWQGYFDLGGGQRFNVGERGLKLPFTLGHEVVGEVAVLGPDAEGVAVGDKRVVFPWIGCGDCGVCRAGRENLCLQPRFVGTRRHGGYADHVLVPHPRYLLNYDGIDEDLAALYACSGITAFGAVNKALPLAKGDTLLTIGAGGVGLMGLRLAQAMTDANIVTADIDEAKRTLARANGAAETIDATEADAAQQVIELSGGGVAAAIDFVGAPSSAQLGFDALRRGGRLVIVGLYGGTLPLSLPMMPFRAASIIGSYVGTLDEMRELLALVRSGKVAPIPVHRRPLAEANAALQDLMAGKVEGRTVLRP